jgi:hypothetical protein
MPRKLKRLAIPPLSGVLHVTSNAEGDEVVLSGDPQGLRSLARVLEALADVDQSKLAMPPNAKEHIHLGPESHLDSASSWLVVSRADFASGEIDDSVATRITRRSRAVREYREHKKA